MAKKNEIDFRLENPENAALAGAQTPSVEAPPEEGETGELEVVVGPEPEAKDEKPEVVTLTPDQFAELKAQSDSSKAIRDGIEGLAGRLVAPAAPQPANAPTQSAEEFFAEHSDDMFDKEKGPAVLKKFVRMVGEQEYGPTLQAQALALQATKKELLEARDPHYKKFKAEVEALVASQPPAVRLQPNVYELAWNQVKQTHQSEINEEEISERVNKALDEKLKALGIDPSKGAVRPAAHVNSAARSVPAQSSAGAGGKRTVRLPDAATEQKLRAEALRRGLDFEDLLRIRGYTS